MKREKNFILLCSLVYFTAYVTRCNYGAVLVEMVDVLGSTNSAISLAVTTSAVAYGIGQLISGYLGDKIPPKKLLFWGLAVTALVNLTMTYVQSIPWITLLWTVNGMAQSLMWPPLVKILAIQLDVDDYKKGCAAVTDRWGWNGTILLWLLLTATATLICHRRSQSHTV